MDKKVYFAKCDCTDIYACEMLYILKGVLSLPHVGWFFKDKNIQVLVRGSGKI